jgi:hypothetical protein
MLRRSLQADSPHIAVLVSARNGVAVETRTTQGGSTTRITGRSASAPRWVRLVRRGDQFTAYESPDGMRWAIIDQRSLDLTSTAVAGLVTSSANTSRTTTAVFDSVTVQAPPPAPVSPPGVGGTGLTGTYFDNVDFTAQRLVRTDATVNFDWGSGSPAASIASNTFSVRWTGTLVPAFDETYTFTARTDDGVRLWVDGQLVVNRWNDQSATDRYGWIDLRAGEPVSIVMEYYENGGRASAKLYWESPSQPYEIIPQGRLLPS